MWRSLLEPVADWRVGLVWRLYGWAGVQQALLLASNRSFAGWLREGSPLVHALTVCSLLLLVLGARPILWLPTAVVATAILIVTALGHDPRLDFPGAELPLFAALPLGACVLWLLAPRVRAAAPRAPGPEDEGREADGALPALEPSAVARRDPAEVAAAVLWLCRVVFLVEMGFAALHKTNRDFFEPALSCATVLSRVLPEWWDTGLAALAGFLTPPVVLLLEGGIPILAAVYWPAGILLLLGFLTGLAITGPTGFTAVTIAAGFSFVRGATAAELFRLPRRRPIVLAVAGVAIVLYARSSYRGPPIYPWPQYALYLCVVALLAACVVDWAVRDLARRWRCGRAGTSKLGTPARATGPARRLGLPGSGRLRVALAVVVLLGIANGLTPYLGWKYQFSFAMLSNLRADRLRWNSLVVPPSARVLDLDPFVEVTKVRVRRSGGRRADPDREIVVALFPPYEFARRVEYHRRLGHRLDVWLTYDGREHFFPRMEQNAAARSFVAGLPRSLLYAKALVPGPQPCVH